MSKFKTMVYEPSEESVHVRLERRHVEDTYSWIHSENKVAMQIIAKALGVPMEGREGNSGHIYYSIYTDAVPYEAIADQLKIMFVDVTKEWFSEKGQKKHRKYKIL